MKIKLTKMENIQKITKLIILGQKILNMNPGKSQIYLKIKLTIKMIYH